MELKLFSEVMVSIYIIFFVLGMAVLLNMAMLISIIHDSKKESEKMPDVRNLPSDHMAMRYLVVKEFENEYWYWASYNNKEAAVFVAGQCFGKVYDQKKEEWVND